MLRVTITFPLGVYHAQSPVSFKEAEWPPSPVRLIGALLAAAHGRHGQDPEPDRALLQRLCEADPPQMIAPINVAIGDVTSAADDDAVVSLRGASRWAPRNHELSELKGLSTRDIARGRAAIEKVGTAIGCRPVHVVWPDVTLDEDEQARLTALATDVTFLGTARSPVLVDVFDDDVPSDDGADRWVPQVDDMLRRGQVSVRVPEPNLILAFDRREAARRSRKGKVETANIVPGARFGRDVLYAPPGTESSFAGPFDPRQWGDILVLVVDREDSSTIVKAPAAYLLARALRASLLGAFAEVGSAGEAPEILRARGSDPHCAIVPLPAVGHEHSDGHIMGVGIVLPHPDRVPDLDEQRARVEHGLLSFFGIGGDRRHVDVPGAGRVFLRPPAAIDGRARALQPATYQRVARRWASVTPVVHSRWRTSSGPASLLKQVTADCADVGLPAPRSVEVVPGSAIAGGPFRAISKAQVPEAWRGLLEGPTDHVRIAFDEPVVGPVLLGRARHFGLGLCLPDPQERGA